MSFKIKPKPKVRIGKLFRSKKLCISSIDTKVEYETQLDEDISFNIKIKADLNYQNKTNIKDRIKSFNFKFTKKF